MSNAGQQEAEVNSTHTSIPWAVVGYHSLLAVSALLLLFHSLSWLALTPRHSSVLAIPPVALACALFLGWSAWGIYHRQAAVVRWARYFHVLIMIVGMIGGCVAMMGIVSLAFFKAPPTLSDHIGQIISVVLGGLALGAALYSWACWRQLREMLRASSDIATSDAPPTNH